MLSWLFYQWMMNNKTIDNIENMRSYFGWDKTDTNEFLVSALLDEVKELAQEMNNPTAFADELADVLMYAIVIAQTNNLDIDSIINHKIEEVMKREY